MNTKDIGSKQRPRKITGEPWRIVFVILCAILFAILAAGRGPSRETHEAILTALRAVDLNHASLQRDVLQARAGLLRNYDPLVQSIVNLHDTVSKLRFLLSEADMDDNSALEALVDDLSDSIDRDEKLVEEFKTRNALLQNSLSIFSQILTELHMSPYQEMQRAVNTSNDLGNLMMRFSAEPQQDLAQQIRIQLDGLQRSNAAVVPDLKTLVTHGRMVLVTTPTVDDMMSAIQASDTSARAQDLQREYLEAYGTVSARASWSRVLLGSISVALCAYIALLVYRLRSQTERLTQRLDFESAMNDVKACFTNLSQQDYSTAIKDALDIIEQFFDADYCEWAIVNLENAEVEETHATKVAASPLSRHHMLDFAQTLRRDEPTSNPSRHRFFYRNLQRKDDFAFTRDAVSAGAAIGMETSNGSAAMLIFGYDESRAKPSSDDVILLQSTIETLIGCVDYYRSRQEREVLETRLEHSQRLEAIGTLAGGIAHEFNNILGAMLGYGEMALQILRRPSQTKHYVQEIVSTGERAKQIIDQVLTFSRKRERTSKPFDVGEAVSDIIPLLQVSLADTFELSAHVPEKPMVILGNPIEIQQIVMNLCKNASEASGETGRVEIDVRPVKVKFKRELSHGELQPGDYIRLSVADHGKGIPEGILPHIFEPFFTTKSSTGGTGLGLSAVHGNVVGLAGQINVDSRVDKGTRFDLFFPASRLPPIPLKQFFNERPVPLGEGQAVVILEKEKPLLMMYEEKLAALGYEPVGFSQLDAIMAWLKFSGGHADLVILDVASLEMSVTPSELDRLFGDIPYLLVADQGRSGQMSEQRLRQLGALKKPVSSKSMASAIFKKINAEA